MGFVLLPRLPESRVAARDGTPLHHAGHVSDGAFLRSALRNVTGGAAEFLPGLLLAPLVLHINGPLEAAYFGIAWTGASLLFLLSASIARSTFAEMARHGDHARLLRRALRQHALIVAPAAVAAVALSPVLLGLFGADYAAHGQLVFLLLAASIVLIAPIYLYLALLRSREDRWVLVLYPAVLVAALFTLTPLLEERFALAGVGLAWLAVHTPLAVFAGWKLRLALGQEEEVTLAHGEIAQTHRRAPHLE